MGQSCSTVRGPSSSDMHIRFMNRQYGLYGANAKPAEPYANCRATVVSGRSAMLASLPRISSAATSAELATTQCVDPSRMCIRGAEPSGELMHGAVHGRPEKV
ncbi:hypothetical protein GUJ93_ZPchr0023g33371 [Zizania palustris]|uniref:Uncharacterized protein n=1 Tax=Zizania palustris TaxID=103762 RepID=A0A8J5UR85_ZIZPA|nr:hypothetical protein GUJ93_ZPchr0023g33371 [Zizania palustris]